MLSLPTAADGGCVETAARAPIAPLRTLLRITVVGVVIARRDGGRILHVNHSFAHMLGYQPAEMLGKTAQDLALYVDAETRARIVAVTDTAETWQAHVTLRHRAGHSVTVRVHASQVAIEGEPCLLGFFEDDAELRRVDEARRAREAELATMFELAPVGLQEVEIASQRLLRVNAAITELTGYTADELSSMRIADYTHPDDRARDRELFAAVAAGAIRAGHVDKRYLRKDGTLRWVQVHFRVIDDEGGDRRRLMAVIIDTTRARQDEQERKLLTGALHAAANGVAITDAAGVIEWVNHAFTELTGYPAGEVLGQNPRVLRSGVQDAAFYAELWRSISAGHTWRGELVNRRKDGSLYDEEMTITPVREEGGAITHHIAIKQDITARKRIDEARVETEERYRLALAASGLGTWRYDPVTAMMTLDVHAQRHYGLPAVASIPDLFAITHPDDRARLREVISLALDPVRPARVVNEHRVVRPDGEVRWLACHAHVTFAGEGAARRPVSAIGTTRDITDSKRAADALRASEDRYRTLVDNLEDLVFSIDTQGRLTFVSNAIERFGYRAEELLGRAIEDFVHPDDRPAMRADLADRMTGAVLPAGERRWIDAAGKVHIMRASARPLVIDGAVVGLTGLATDVTQQRETEEQLRQIQRMEAIGRLAGGVAHDFNNLLSVITAYTELAMADLRDEDPLHADLQEIAEAAQRAAGLTRQLLAFSRRQVLQPEPVELGGLVDGMSNMLRRLIGEDILLQVDVAPGLGVVRVDRGQLEQVVMNLAVNARDAMPDGGELAIACRNVQLAGAAAAALELAAGDYVELAIADTGVGMSASVQRRIFEPFFTTKPVGKGTGLGLSMVHGIVKQSGGGIAVESELDIGSTFRIYLPRLVAGAGDTDARQTDHGAHPRGHERILVVEDEAALRSVTRRLLAAAGYQVDVAANAGEALLLCEEHGAELDLVLTDVVMPGLSGRKLAERLTALCPSAKVMFMSGYTDEMLAQHDVLQHAFIRKPFDRATLAAKVRAILDGK